MANQFWYGRSSEGAPRDHKRTRVTRRFTPPSSHQNCRLSCPHEQGSARRTRPSAQDRGNGRRGLLGCCRNRNHRGHEISTRTYFPVISRLPVLTGYFGSDKFPVRPYGHQARGFRKYLIEQTLWRRVRADFELEFDFFREFSRANREFREFYDPRPVHSSPTTCGLSYRRLGSQSHFASERRGRRATLHRESECRDLSKERENDGV